MPTLSTTVDSRSSSYLDNRQAMLARLDELDEALAAARTRGGDRAGSYDPVGQYDSAGLYRTQSRLLARERVELLLDRDAPFLELCPLAGWGTDQPTGAGVIGGVGRGAGAQRL